MAASMFESVCPCLEHMTSCRQLYLIHHVVIVVEGSTADHLDGVWSVVMLAGGLHHTGKGTTAWPVSASQADKLVDICCMQF